MHKTVHKILLSITDDSIKISLHEQEKTIKIFLHIVKKT